MSDLISKRFIQDALIERISNLNAEGEKSIQTARELIRFKKFVDGITPIRAETVQGWIPVSERLPKEYAQYLVCFETGECYVYWLEDSDWSRSVSEKEGILAWMPLPEPYREDEHE